MPAQADVLPLRPRIADRRSVGHPQRWNYRSGHRSFDAKSPPIRPSAAQPETTENRPQIIPADGSAMGGCRANATIAQHNHARIALAINTDEDPT